MEGRLQELRWSREARETFASAILAKIEVERQIRRRRMREAGLHDVEIIDLDLE